MRYPDPGLAEFLSLRGFDVIVFDGEHGPLSAAASEQLNRAVELHGVTPGVRVVENHPSTILRYMDAGALVCHVPGVASRDDAERAVRAVKYQPLGNRGLAASRASGFGPAQGYAHYVAETNRETLVVVHVESAGGAAAAAEIASVDGIDVLLIGALDLSHDLGVPGELGHPDVIAASERIIAAAASREKTVGVVVSDAAGKNDWIDRGARYILTTVESLLRPAVDGFLEQVRDH
jgi:2-keto-3-deoxy-L-rhamnonate aldolase RhmA